MTDISDFVQQSHNFIIPWVKLARYAPFGLRLSCSWQTDDDRLIDGPFPEDRTDFSSYATGASPDILERDCRHMVVAGDAY